MDLITEMIKTKRIETNKIESYSAKRMEALNESEKFLSQDIKSFVDFFKKNSQKSKEAEATADEKMKERIKRQTELKTKEDEYQKVLSNIRKNVEILEEYHRYKKFLDSVYQRTNQITRDENNSTIEEADDKENVHPNLHNQPLSLNKRDSADKSLKKVVDSKNKVKDPLIQVGAAQEIIDLVNNNEFNYKVGFENPDELLKSFMLMEEKCLFLIQQIQEAEQVIEDKTQQFRMRKKKIDREIDKLMRDKQDIQNKIGQNIDDITFITSKEHSIKNVKLSTIDRIHQKISHIVSNVIYKGNTRIVDHSNQNSLLGKNSDLSNGLNVNLKNQSQQSLVMITDIEKYLEEVSKIVH